MSFQLSVNKRCLSAPDATSLAEELEEKELDKVQFLEVLIFKFYHRLRTFIGVL